VQFSVLGPLRIRRRADELACGQPRQSAVLASLLLRHGTPVSLSALVDDVWGEDAPASAPGSIRTYIYRLRRILESGGDSPIRLVSGGYLLDIDSAALDLNRFTSLAAKARGAHSAGRLAEAADSYADCLATWRGPALVGVPGPFAEAQRGHLSQLRLATTEDHLACEVERGRYAESVAELAALVSEHPLRERLCEMYMTALYGLGRQSEALKAFYDTSHMLNEQLGVRPSPNLRRIHQQILANELTLPLAKPGPGRPESRTPTVFVPPAQLPAGLPRFVERDETESVRRLIAAGAASTSMVTCVVGGLAGVGKTAFAVHLARRVTDRFPDGQLFADLGGFGPSATARAPVEVLADFLETLGVPAECQPAGTAARALLFRGLLAGRRMLVVLDNARDAGQVRDLLPGSGGSLAIVTSRHQLHGLLARHQAVPVLLGPLDTGRARELLVHGIGTSRAAAEPAAVDDILVACGGLPLALSLVAARAAYRPAASLEGIAADVGGRANPLDAFADDSDPGLDIRTVLSWSYRTLEPDCASFFRSLSLCPGTEFTDGAAAAAACLPAEHARSLLRRLARTHLVSEQEPGLYRWHTLVRAYATELFRAEEGRAVRSRALERRGDRRPGTGSGNPSGESGGTSRLRVLTSVRKAAPPRVDTMSMSRP
jgi:DNA-binding SARP family transcriptional activator